jgi:hypothetical protein
MTSILILAGAVVLAFIAFKVIRFITSLFLKLAFFTVLLVVFLSLGWHYFGK